MDTRVLITGGAGYIGSTLCPMLLQKGFSVTVLDNLYYRQSSLFACASSPRFRFVYGDACDEALLKEELKRADVILPLAAFVGAPACDRAPVLATAVTRDAIQLLLTHSSPSQLIIYPCTNSGYGIQESQYCTEETPLCPVSLYGKLKVEGEAILLNAQRAVSLRLATVFGVSPRMRLDLLINDFTFRACHDRFIVLFEEEFKRNHVHVQDVAKAFLFAIEHYHQMRGQAFNVGLSNANLSKRDLCEKIKTFLPDLYINSAQVGKDPDQRNYNVSNAKIEQLGWRATVSVDEGIREIINSYPMLRMSAFKNV